MPVFTCRKLVCNQLIAGIYAYPLALTKWKYDIMSNIKREVGVIWARFGF
jgi:hypothetical protein